VNGDERCDIDIVSQPLVSLPTLYGAGELCNAIRLQLAHSNVTGRDSEYETSTVRVDGLFGSDDRPTLVEKSFERINVLLLRSRAIHVVQRCIKGSKESFERNYDGLNEQGSQRIKVVIERRCRNVSATRNFVNA
jgi:hypothetical protein